MKRLKTLTLIIIIVLLFALPAVAVDEDKKPSPSPSPSSSPIIKKVDPDSGETGVFKDPFKDEKPTKFEFDEKKKKKITLLSCGYRYTIEAYEVEPGKILIPLSNRSTDLILDKFGTKAKYNKKNREVVFTRNKKEMRMKIDYDEMYYAGKKREIPAPPRIIEGMVHISPNSFDKFVWACCLYDEKRKIYYLDPWVLDVKLETNKRGLTKVAARGTGPFRHRILKLRKPTRFVVDVMNACLDGKQRAIHHPTLGAIRFSQHELKGEEGNIVRIVIPESENIEVAMAEPRAENYVEAELRKRGQATAVIDMDVQKITDIDVKDGKDLVTIIVEATGPIQLEWSRLLPPDDRFFIDIPGAYYPKKKKTFDLKSKFLPKVVVAQNEPMPNPRVRMVLPLEDPRKISLKADKDNPNRLKIYVSKEKIKPDQSARKGFFITYYPTKGLVICIDPGHGGSDPGAVNRKLKMMEKDLTWDISRRLKKILKKKGWTVIMTRNSDRDVTYPGSPDYEELGARTSIANDLKAHIFLSVHINASVRSSVNGIATYWYKGTDRKLTKYIHSALVSRTGRKNLGIRRERFFLLRTSKMPASLLEVGFLSNYNEAKLLSKPSFRQKAAEAIAEGLKNYAHAVKLGNGKKNNKKSK